MAFEGTTELPVDHAFAAIATNFEHLVKLLSDGGLASFDRSRLIRFMQDSEQLRNQWSLIDHHTIAAAERLDVADRAVSRVDAQRVEVGAESVET